MLRCCLSLLLACLAGTAHAAKPSPPTDPTQDPVLLSAGFLSAHPDLRFRILALEKREAGKLEEAFRLFQRAAWYADKPSQAMVAEMLWFSRRGEGKNYNSPNPSACPSAPTCNKRKVLVAPLVSICSPLVKITRSPGPRHPASTNRRMLPRAAWRGVWPRLS